MWTALASCGPRGPHQSLVGFFIDVEDEAGVVDGLLLLVLRANLAFRLGSPTTLRPCRFASSLLT